MSHQNPPDAARVSRIFFYISRSREKIPAGQAAPQVSVRPAA